MNASRFREITSSYADLRITIVGDFCLDRYLEIDPGKGETSIETGLPVHNVVRIRSLPGAAGTILNNLVALGVGEIRPVGFCGEDGEGAELVRALRGLRGVRMDGFIQTPERHTFTYTKPLICRPGCPPEELNRLDIKNWDPTPPTVARRIVEAASAAMHQSDATIVLDQVDLPWTGVVVESWLEVLRAEMHSGRRLVVGDSRRGLRGWPPIVLKMNAAELAKLQGAQAGGGVAAVLGQARELANRNRNRVLVTMAEQGIVGAEPGADPVHVPALPVRGPIDVVGAGDGVTANLVSAMAAGATVSEAMELAMGAASVVIHQLGTTGTATVEQVRERVVPAGHV